MGQLLLLNVMQQNSTRLCQLDIIRQNIQLRFGHVYQLFGFGLIIKSDLKY